MKGTTGIQKHTPSIVPSPQVDTKSSTPAEPSRVEEKIEETPTTHTKAFQQSGAQRKTDLDNRGQFLKSQLQESLKNKRSEQKQTRFQQAVALLKNSSPEEIAKNVETAYEKDPQFLAQLLERTAVVDSAQGRSSYEKALDGLMQAANFENKPLLADSKSQFYKEVAKLSGEGSEQVKHDVALIIRENISKAEKTKLGGPDVGQYKQRVHELLGPAAVDFLRKPEPPGPLETQIGKLSKEGDSVALSLGGFGQIELRVEGQGDVTVTRQGTAEKPVYEVEMSGQINAGLAPELGASVGGRLEGQAKGMLSAGGSLILQFHNPADAARALEIAGKGALATSLSPPGTGHLILPVAVPEKDRSFLKKHATGIQFTGDAAAEIGGSFGFGLDKGKLQIAGINASDGIATNLAARVDFPTGNDSGKVTFSAAQSLHSQKSAGIAVGGKDKIIPRIGMGGTSNLQLKIEQTFVLPEVDPDSLRKDALGTIKNMASEIDKNAEVSLRISGSLQKEIVGREAVATGSAEKNDAFEIELKGHSAKMRESLLRALRLDLKGALEIAGEDLSCSAKTEWSVSYGLKISPEVTVMGVGAGFSAGAERIQKTPGRNYSGNAREVLAWISNQF